jgi:hypothetical protein
MRSSIVVEAVASSDEAAVNAAVVVDSCRFVEAVIAKSSAEVGVTRGFRGRKRPVKGSRGLFPFLGMCLYRAIEHPEGIGVF